MISVQGWFSRCVIATGTCLALLGAASPTWAQKVVLSTSMGDIEVALNPSKAPKTVENFVAYVKEGHYDGTIFHRVISNFMIQGGGMTPDLKEKKTRPSIALESKNGLKNDRGTLAMARRADPDSATAQFFINVQNNDFLNAGTSDGYAVFGAVTSGMDVVDKIRAVQTSTQGMYSDVPVKPVTILKARLIP